MGRIRDRNRLAAVLANGPRFPEAPRDVEAPRESSYRIMGQGSSVVHAGGPSKHVGYFVTFCNGRSIRASRHVDDAPVTCKACLKAGA